MVGGTLLQPQSFLRHGRPLSSPTSTRSPTCDLGRVDIVISAEIFFFCCDNSGVKRETPDGRAQTYPTYPGMRSGQAKIIHKEKADTKQEHNALSLT